MEFPSNNNSFSDTAVNWASRHPFQAGVVLFAGYALYRYIFPEQEQRQPQRAIPRRVTAQPLDGPKPRLRLEAQSANRLAQQRGRLFEDAGALQAKMQKAFGRANTEDALRAFCPHRPDTVELELSQYEPLADKVEQQSLEMLHVTCATLRDNEKRVVKANEDRSLCGSFELPRNRGQVCFTAVMDGHGGRQSSMFVAKQLQAELEKSFEVHCQAELDDCSIANALTQCFVKLSEELKSQANPSGTTLNLVVHLNGRIWCANSGDSRAVLVEESGNVIALSEDAKTNDKYWQKSPAKYGAKFTWDYDDQVWRINLLSMSRSIGCYQGSYGSTPRPKLTVVDAPKTAFCIVQGSDGLWDAISSQELAASTTAYDGDRQELAARLVALARGIGSGDDITVLVTRPGQ